MCKMFIQHKTNFTNCFTCVGKLQRNVVEISNERACFITVTKVQSFSLHLSGRKDLSASSTVSKNILELRPVLSQEFSRESVMALFCFIYLWHFLQFLHGFFSYLW